MKFPFFASFIIFIIWLAYENQKHNKIERKARDDFWETERRANSTRRKSLENLPYITIPMDTFPTELFPEDETVQDILKTLSHLAAAKIVNFTGYTNTQLKLEYGAPNISMLMEYDQNYTLLVRNVQKWADILYEKGYVEETKTLLEFAVSTHTDVSKTYKLLAAIYFSEGDFDKIQELINTAEQLNSAMKSTIVRTLKESYLYSG